MDTKGPIDPPLQHKSYIHVINDAFCYFDVTVPIKSITAKTALKIFFTSLDYQIWSTNLPCFRSRIRIYK